MNYPPDNERVANENGAGASEDSAPQPDERPSRSQRKREADEVAAFARELGDMSPPDLDRVGLSEKVRQAVAELQQISKRGAGKRQLLYVAKLLRKEEENLPGWKEACAKIKLPEQLEVRSFHLAERWRDRLLEADSATRTTALTEFIESFPDTDTQKLRQLIRNIDRQNSAEARKRLSRELFRCLRDAID